MSSFKSTWGKQLNVEKLHILQFNIPIQQYYHKQVLGDVVGPLYKFEDEGKNNICEVVF